ncbi:MAG: glycerate kinase [Leucobacter sp.]
MTLRKPLIVVAPDALKGSCTSAEAARALAAGARAATDGAFRVLELPLADGGEGTLDALVAASNGRIELIDTVDALGRPRQGRLGFSEDGRLAIVEAAEANGLPLVLDRPLRALDADSFGVGTLIRAALAEGAEELLICLGGSATSDGGAGMLRALGAKLLDDAGDPVPAGARGLSRLAAIDLSEVAPEAASVRWRFATDVTNPLTGDQGAAAVFGPQKGASPADVALIDAGLDRLAAVLAELSEVDRARVSASPGSGAAGGLAIGPLTLWGGRCEPGSDLVARATGLDAALADAALVLTGEGRVDSQSLGGKVLSRVITGTPSGVPVIVIAGSVGLTAEECRHAGVTAAFSIAPGAASLDELQRRAPELLAETAAHACRLATTGMRI